MGRISISIAGVLIATALRLSAQEGPSSFEFVENKGQWNSAVQFMGELSSGAFFIQKNGFTVSLYHPDDLKLLMGHGQERNAHAGADKFRKIDYTRDMSGTVTDRNIAPEKKLRGHAYRVEFVGADSTSAAFPEKAVQSYNNYFLGNDPSKWVSKARIFQSIFYKNIYPGIDLRYYSENGKLKYDLIIHPGGDPSKIVMQYTGVDKLSLKNNELVIKTSVGSLKELYPYSYQPDNIKGRKQIDCKYVLGANNTVRFQLGTYSGNETLIIDPSLIFVSFTGSSANQYGFTATPGPDGSLFSGGIVFGSGFPTTTGAYQRSFAGGKVDIGIMKFSPNGSQRLYATYIGGSDDDYPHSLFSDAAGNLVVMGRSYSSNYPGGTVGSRGGCNIVVTKLNATGTGIIGSLSIGGSANDGVNMADLQHTSTDHTGTTPLLKNYGDDSRSEVILDGAANIYIAAQTQSDDFPIIGSTFQPTIGGNQDGVVLKINPNCNAVIWSSFLGGPGQDGAFVLELNPLNNELYVGGGTTSTAFPGISPSSKYPSYQGGQSDGYVARISNDGSTLIRSTYLGTSNTDIVYGLKFDKKGFPYVMGISIGGTWPVVNVLYSIPNSSQFVAKLQPDLTDFIFSTVFGSGSRIPNMSPVAFLVDRCENMYISGWGGWIYPPSPGESDPYGQAGVAGMPITADAMQSVTDNRDFYFIVIEKNANDVLYGTYLGQSGGRTGEHVDGGTSRYDQSGVIYQAICANCAGGATFPTTPGVIGRVNGALPSGCNLAAAKIAFNFAGVISGPRPTINGVRDTLGCVPFRVTFQDTIRNAKSYEWDFGDGSDTATTEFEVVHEYATTGTFHIRLIAIDLTTCNERDTAYTIVTVRSDKANLDFDIEKQEPCQDLNYKFSNLSSLSPGAKPFNDSSFVWDFGDGSPPIATGTNSITRAYAEPGTYNVKFYLVDTGYCNSPDSLTTQVFVNPLVDARFETPAAGCAPYDAVFTNTSLAGETFEWNFGDGSPVSVESNPVHHYENAGTYTIRLTARNPGTCNLVDDTTITITVSNRPTAEFSHTPVVPVQNTPTIFTNLSAGGVRYKWLFGDGDSVIKNTRDTVLHQYNATGTYNACLITYNQFDCTDTACHEVQADILPLLDVPNAFTPGKFGKNSRIRVEGFGIAKMSWKIFNRWGQKVFETNDRLGAWDGTYNGQIQPMDVYQYTLDVQFVDGTATRKTGDITLIR